MIEFGLAMKNISELRKPFPHKEGWLPVLHWLDERPYRFTGNETNLHFDCIHIEPGLSESEIEHAQQVHDFEFPYDLRRFLTMGMPVGPKFPNWREPENPEMKQWFELPIIGVLEDVEDDIWWEFWGPRPSELSQALFVVENLVKNAPKLLPLFAHRMMPCEPLTPGNPIFSIHSTDIIYYGANLRNYLYNEFASPPVELLVHEAEECVNNGGLVSRCLSFFNNRRTLKHRDVLVSVAPLWSMADLEIRPIRFWSKFC